MSNMRRIENELGVPGTSLALLLTLLGCCWPSAVVTSTVSARQSIQLAQAKPAPAPARWRGLIGEYGPDDDILIILEKDGRLCALFKRKDLDVLDEVSKGVFRFSNAAREGWRATFKRDRIGRVTYIEMRKDV